MTSDFHKDNFPVLSLNQVYRLHLLMPCLTSLTDAMSVKVPLQAELNFFEVSSRKISDLDKFLQFLFVNSVHISVLQS